MRWRTSTRTPSRDCETFASRRELPLASEQVAVRAVVVHAVDENAARFYERFGFQALSATPRTLMVTLAALRTAGYE
jgi:hypothetical protein